MCRSALLLSLLEESERCPPPSLAGLLLLVSEAPPPWPLPDELEEGEEERGAELSAALEVKQRERVEQEEERAGLPLSSTRLELFSRPPPSLWEELCPCRGWSLNGLRLDLEEVRAGDSLRKSGRAESESERFMASLTGREEKSGFLSGGASWSPEVRL